MRILALITARGGSKGIPRKNLADLGGKPLIAWTIEAARKSTSVDRLIVSTDDPEIASVSKKYGAEVPFMRPSELAQDTSAHIPVIQHALEWVGHDEGRVPDVLLLLQPTSPFRTAADIESALKLMQEKNADAVISVMPAPVPLWLLRTTDSNGFLRPVADIPTAYLRRQDAPPLYALNGALYACKSHIIMEQNTLTPPNTLPYVMSPESSLDIDEPSDLETARQRLSNE